VLERNRYLIEVIQQLSLARDLDRVMALVRTAARVLGGADGAAFVLRDGDLCFYADEDAIAPLWKGKRFSIDSCVSGWAMTHHETVVIEDIYQDPRIPLDAYRPTFVKSLVLVPIRTAQPIGAIGNYWAKQHRPSDDDLAMLKALADSTSIAIENVQLYADLERRVRERTAELEASNAELEAFSYSVSHDLRAPLRSIDGFSRALLDDYAGVLDETGRRYLQRVGAATRRMGQLIDDLLALGRVGRATLVRKRVDVSLLVETIAGELAEREPARAGVTVEVARGLEVHADEGLLRVVFENLLDNARKFTLRAEAARIEVGRTVEGALFVRDNGAGFDPAEASGLFKPFTRLHTDPVYPGTGIGLATVERAIRRHGGRIWADAAVGHGATFTFTLSPAA
jgi:signal transduction histidine kinase